MQRCRELAARLRQRAQRRQRHTHKAQFIEHFEGVRHARERCGLLAFHKRPETRLHRAAAGNQQRRALRQVGMNH